jgi:hypothetical protein
MHFSTDNMGRFYRGLDYYNLHFQGAIHFGFLVAGLLAYNNEDLIKCIRVRCQGQCCEEKLPDFQLVNEFDPLKVGVMKGNALLYTSISSAQLVQYDSHRALVSFVKRAYSSQAIAYLILEIILTSNIYLIGMMEKTHQ